MRMWGKIFKDNRLLSDTVSENYDLELNRTRKIYAMLDEICYTMDLEKPIWLDVNKQDFIRTSKCRFTKDSFIETVEFDFLEIQVIEDDY